MYSISMQNLNLKYIMLWAMIAFDGTVLNSAKELV
jgi:hypothetical protein